MPLVRAGMPYDEIGRRIGISRSRAHTIAAKHGVIRSGKRVPVRNIVVLYTDEKWSIDRLAKSLGVAPDRIRRILKQHGVKTRIGGRIPTVPTATVALWRRRGMTWAAMARAAGKPGHSFAVALRMQYRRAVERGEITP